MSDQPREAPQPTKSDYYELWLGVPPGSRPPDHYALLGLPMFCEDLRLIEAATKRQMNKLDRFRLHPGATEREVCTRLMNLVAQARLVLSESRTRQQYDRQLAAHLGVAPPAAVHKDMRGVQVLRSGVTAQAAPQAEPDEPRALVWLILGAVLAAGGAFAWWWLR